MQASLQLFTIAELQESIAFGLPRFIVNAVAYGCWGNLGEMGSKCFIACREREIAYGGLSGVLGKRTIQAKNKDKITYSPMNTMNL